MDKLTDPNTISNLMSAVPNIIALASIAASFLPPPDGPGAWSKVHKAINLIAFNFGNAANK